MDRGLNPNSLSIVHWNAGGLGNKINEVPTFLQKYNVDILTVGETSYNKNSKSKIPGYKCYRRDRDVSKKAAGGVALYVRNNLPCVEVQINNIKSLEAHAIKLENKLTVVVLYAPPKNKILKTDLQQILNLGNKVIAAGDLNAKHLSWNCYYNNKNGNTIYNYMERNPYTLEYPSNFTLYPHKLTWPSIVHLAIIKNIVNLESIEALNELNSDHKPVLMLFTNNQINTQSSFSPQYPNYKNAD